MKFGATHSCLSVDNSLGQNVCRYSAVSGKSLLFAACVLFNAAASDECARSSVNCNPKTTCVLNSMHGHAESDNMPHKPRWLTSPTFTGLQMRSYPSQRCRLTARREAMGIPA